MLFAFGSGRPVDEWCICLDLLIDAYMRPTLYGPLAKDGFTVASALLKIAGVGWFVMGVPRRKAEVL